MEASESEELVLHSFSQAHASSYHCMQHSYAQEIQRNWFHPFGNEHFVLGLCDESASKEFSQYKLLIHDLVLDKEFQQQYRMDSKS